MIEQDNYVKYDFNGHYYYLTSSGVEAYSFLTGIALNWDESRLQTQGRLLHQALTKSKHNQTRPRYKQKDIIEYYIYLNENNERQAVIDSLVNFALASDSTDMDLDVINGEKQISMQILQPLREVGLYYFGKLQDYVPEEIYALRGVENDGY